MQFEFLIYFYSKCILKDIPFQIHFCRFIVSRKRVIYAAIGAAIAVILLVGVIFLFKRSTPENLHGGGIVANGLECAAIAR